MTRRLSLLVACAALACGEPPTTPPIDPGPDPDPIVSSVTVTSDVGAVFAIGGATQLRAEAADASGTAIPATLVWASSDPSVATVSTVGRMTAASPGSVNVTASVGSVTGTFAVTVEDVDLVGLRALIDDPFALALIDGLGASAADPVDATWAACDQALNDGHLTLLQECAAEARTTLATSTDASTRPLRSLIELLLDWIDRFLNPTTVS